MRPSDPDAKCQLAKFGQAQKTKFQVFGFKSDKALLTFTFRFLSSPPLSLFLPHFSLSLSFFFFAGHLVGFILEENVSGKAFRILVCYTAVLSVVTRRSSPQKECGSIISSRLWGEALRDDTKIGCVADY